MKEDQKIFDPDCVPEGFVLSDPDHLTAAEISSLYNHWLSRQHRNLPPFVVLNPGPHHPSPHPQSEKVKGKRKMPYVDVDSTDDEPGKLVGGDEESEEAEGFGDEEDLSRRVKFGPPKGNHQTNVAGSSKHPTTKAQNLDTEAPTEKPKPQRKDKTVQSKKRKAAEELQPHSPKSLKTARGGKAGRTTGQVPVTEPVVVSNPNHTAKQGGRLNDTP
jgi:hypothetical protein